MVGIQGIGGVPEPKPEKPASVRERNDADATTEASPSDGLVISSEAQAAATLATSIRAASLQTDVRADKVAAARDAIERGDYRRPEIVEKVAQRIEKYL